MKWFHRNLFAAAGLCSTVFFVAIAVYAQSQNVPPSRSLLVRPSIAQGAGTPALRSTPAAEPLPSPQPVWQTALTMQQPVIDEGVSAPDTLPSPESIVSPNAPGTIRKTPPIKYDTDSDARRLYASGSVDMIMVTENPADHCVYEIPLCIPAPGGFEVKIRFRNIGDIRVDYEGD
jgi:hypothetical protein